MLLKVTVTLTSLHQLTSLYRLTSLRPPLMQSILQTLNKASDDLKIQTQTREISVFASCEMMDLQGASRLPDLDLDQVNLFLTYSFAEYRDAPHPQREPGRDQGRCYLREGKRHPMGREDSRTAGRVLSSR